MTSCAGVPSGASGCGFSTGTEVFADVTVGGVSTGGRAVSITITPANDAPVFAGSNLTIGLTETAARDARLSGWSNALARVLQ